MPSSLAAVHSSALVYSTQLRVSVFSTGRYTRFSWKSLLVFASAVTYAQGAIPSALRHLVTPSLSLYSGCRNVDLLAIGFPFRVLLRARLTLIRLTLIRNPWSCGVEVSHPHYRYLCLHLLFHALHIILQYCFGGPGMLPYQSPPSSYPHLGGRRKGGHPRLR